MTLEHKQQLNWSYTVYNLKSAFKRLSLFMTRPAGVLYVIMLYKYMLLSSLQLCLHTSWYIFPIVFSLFLVRAIYLDALNQGA